MFGFKTGDLVGRSLSDLICPSPVPPDDAVAEIREALRVSGRWRGEIKSLRKDGSAFWCALNVTEFHHPSLGPAWIVVTTDITARRQAEEAQTNLASIVQASRDAILATSLDGTVTSWNHGAEMLFGYAAGEMVGGLIDVLIPAERWDEELELRGRVARGLGVEQLETVRLRKDGTPVDVSVALSPIADAGGTITGIAAICRDVTERNRGEASSRGCWRAPPTPLSWSGRVAGPAGRAPDPERFAANHPRLRTGFLADASARAMGANLELSTSVDADAPAFVRGDPGRLRQVLTNLVGNAIKFSDRGKVAVQVHAGAESGGVARLRFEVADNGIGIPDHAQRQLFQAFEQVDTSASRRHGGTGLGLAISKQLVEMMGGDIGFESTLGAGSTFWFDVPLAVASAPPAKVHRQDQVEQRVHGGARLLVAEDNPVNQLVAVRMLERLGYRADVAANGSEAVDALMRIDYAAVLMDCQMPEMDGFEATREIRRRQAGGRRTPVIAMTAAAAEEDRQRCFEADMDDYISKPVRSEDLGTVLARWLSGGQAGNDEPEVTSRIPHTVA